MWKLKRIWLRKIIGNNEEEISQRFAILLNNMIKIKFSLSQA